MATEQSKQSKHLSTPHNKVMLACGYYEGYEEQFLSEEILILCY